MRKKRRKGPVIIYRLGRVGVGGPGGLGFGAKQDEI